MCETIPSNIVASFLRLVKLEYLKFEDENLEKPPEISF